MPGSLGAIALDFALAGIGIATFTAGVVGFWGRRLSPLFRCACVALGVLSLPPGFLPVPAALLAVGIADALRLRKPNSDHLSFREEPR